ncbi:hypothetical protein CEN41_12965 [Fischerella thermalis CCMEE 5330]|uniref:DUF11 domain-containing protein n=1 Tax=Fischerella thermalis CCMEE 5330 TaxID=2019670 RepID=A0A2N6M9H4_9CYAN|nr:DUF11 domain-containing protein [Fischerella thermalis]PMB43439.1 hypothetical protein CEN41_12965 [Fischerella thermalis CCMEE 5330]
MKRFSIGSMGAVALIVTLPFVNQIPILTNIWHSHAALAQNTQAKGQVELRLEAEKKILGQQVQGKQKESWQKLSGKAVVQPGDILRYTVTGVNNGNKAVKNLVINQPIAKGMIYVLNSATVNPNTGAKITYSIDNGRTFVEKPTVKVKLPNGKVETRPAPAIAYTHIRWNFGTSVAAKAQIKGTYQVQVR